VKLSVFLCMLPCVTAIMLDKKMVG